MPQWQRNLYAIWAAQFLAMVGLTLIVPFLPFYLRTLGVATTEDVERWSGFLFAAPFLVQTLATDPVISHPASRRAPSSWCRTADAVRPVDSADAITLLCSATSW